MPGDPQCRQHALTCEQLAEGALTLEETGRANFLVPTAPLQNARAVRKEGGDILSLTTLLPVSGEAAHASTIKCRLLALSGPIQ
jgi:hypothetical protein